jgi:2-alkenal reductase
MKKLNIVIVFTLLAGATLACRFGLPTSSISNSSALSTLVPAATSTLPPNPSVPTLSAATQSAQDNRISSLQTSQDALVNLYKQVSPGVVSITVETDQGTALGSGFVYDADGHIITNYHVIEGATDQEVDFPSGVKAHAKVIGTDLDSDIAVLQVANVDAKDLHPLTLGDSSKLQVGQTLIAIGNPFGLTGTMTTGIVSAMGRTLESMRESSAGTYYSAGDLIQTDAAINPGNSGGPLLNMAGEVVGINRAIRTNNTTDTGEPTNSGIGFAVSINIVKRVVPVLIKTGKYDYPYLGITSQDGMSLTEQEALGLPQSTGAYVTEVAAGGPADKAGIIGGSQPTNIQGLNKGGDLIVAVDGHPVLVFGDLLGYLMNNKVPGDQIVLTVLRNGQSKEITLTLEKRP